MSQKSFVYLLVFAMLLWGGGWTALKILTYDTPLEVVVFWRFFIMALAFLPILAFLKVPLRLGKTNLSFIFGSSVLNFLFMLSSYLGVKHGLAGAGGVIITTLSPVMTFLLMALLFKIPINKIQILGLSLGIFGAMILLELYDLSLFFQSANIYYFLCAAIWAGVTVLSQYSKEHIHPIHYSFFISVVASTAAYFYAYSYDLSEVFEKSLEFWVALLYLAVLGQSVATTIFFIAAGKLGSNTTSSYMLLVPIFALLIAWLLLDEPLELHIITGGVVSLIALWLINKKGSV